jgi:uncharacterized protein (TIGR03435 family)
MASKWLPVLALGSFLSMQVLYAQTAPGAAASADKLPAFDVATIRPVDPNSMHNVGVNVSPGGRVQLDGLTFKEMIMVAFHVSYWQISGGDEWTEKLQYNVVAEPAESYRATMPSSRHSLFAIEDEHLRQMLQTLLADRFQLKIHAETKTGKVYLLEKSGKALELKPTKGSTKDGSDSSSIGWAEKWVLFDTSMPDLAKFAADFVLHSPVTDRTGLNGNFDYRSPPEPAEVYRQDETGSFLNMVHDIGLKLSPSKGPVETLVIDHAEKPSDN